MIERAVLLRWAAAGAGLLVGVVAGWWLVVTPWVFLGGLGAIPGLGLALLAGAVAWHRRQAPVAYAFTVGVVGVGFLAAGYAWLLESSLQGFD